MKRLLRKIFRFFVCFWSRYHFFERAHSAAKKYGKLEKVINDDGGDNDDDVVEGSDATRIGPTSGH